MRTTAEDTWPDQIVLFGSRADGTASPGSDVDLVVVYSGPESKHGRQVRTRRLFVLPSSSMDLSIVTPDESESRRGPAKSLAPKVSESGVVCYEPEPDDASDAVRFAQDVMPFVLAKLGPLWRRWPRGWSRTGAGTTSGAPFVFARHAARAATSTP